MQVEEWQELRWIDKCTAEQSARLYHKVDNARARSMELDVVEIMKEELVSISRGGGGGVR